MLQRGEFSLSSVLYVCNTSYHNGPMAARIGIEGDEPPPASGRQHDDGLPADELIDEAGWRRLRRAGGVSVAVVI